MRHAAPRQRTAAERATHPARRTLALALAFPLAIFLGVFAGAGQAVAADSFPGIDDDSNGTIDSWFLGCDADNDGYGDGCTGSIGDGDCEDNDYHIRPDGRQYADGCTGSDVRVCAANGSGWGTCGAMVEEHTGSGDDYCIDDATGSDSNNGQFPSNCWQTFKMISDGQTTPPAGKHNLVAGDVVWIKSGTYDTIFSGTMTNCGNNILCIQDRDGTGANPIKIKAWPGHTPTIDFNGGGNNDEQVYVEYSEYFTVQGLRFDAAGLRYAGTMTGSKMLDNIVWDRDCNVNNNCSGLYLGVDNSTDIEVLYNDVRDTYDRANIVNHNNTLIVIFGACEMRVGYNRLWNATAGLSLAWKHKHGNASCNYASEFDHNIVIRGTSTSFAASLHSGQSVNVHHNYIGGCGSGDRWIYMADLGGPVNFAADSTITKNVFTCGNGLDYRPELDAVATVGQMRIFENTLVTQAASGDTVEVCRYGADASYDEVVTAGTLLFEDNCYYTPSLANISYCIYCNNGGNESWCTQGGGSTPSSVNNLSYPNLAAAQAAGYDVGSFDKGSTSGAFDADGIPTDADCDTFSWRADTGAAPTPTPSARNIGSLAARYQ